ncbi:MAG: hypothetical protein P4L51_15340, partial [Puia sp.]|nr:hypothetical protein [Puia sp.]
RPDPNPDGRLSYEVKWMKCRFLAIFLIFFMTLFCFGRFGPSAISNIQGIMARLNEGWYIT